MRGIATLAVLFLTVLIAACGDGGSNDGSQRASVSAEVERRIGDAANVSAADFPPVRGRRLQAIANLSDAGAELGLATSVYTPGKQRLAFGILDNEKSFVYGKTAIYISRGPRETAIGPYAAPADSLLVNPPYRSQTAASASGDITGIYATNVPFSQPGKYAIVSLTRYGGRLIGATTALTVKRTSAIPAPGQRPPIVETDTLVGAQGNIKSIDTRVPPDDMHDVDFKSVVGKRPIALIFATPQLCESRVCGPVVDVAAQVKKQYGDRVQFIHQEVFVDNEVQKGYRPALQAFNLRTEPWLFTFDRFGRVAARLEGSFGINTFTRAVEKALRAEV